MTAKHTKGPWGRNIPPASKYPVIYAGRNTHVAQVISKGLPDAEVEANANLIAAAPELLALARRVARLGQHPAPGQRECLCGQCDMVRTAIRLANQAEGSYSPRQVGWELERTAMGDGFYGNALLVVRSLVALTPEELAVVQRFECGTHSGTDHVTLQDLALRVYSTGEKQ